MQTRTIKIGDYNTYADGLWTLTGWSLSPAEHEQNFVTVPGGSAPLDLAGALTDGEPTYLPRTLVATFESSEGSRLARKARIDKMINQLDGWTFHIVLPDDPDKYLIGKVRVQELYNDIAHASVQVDAVCHPWKYAKDETVAAVQAESTQRTLALFNKGRRSVVPTLNVEGGEVTLSYKTSTWALGEGVHVLPALYLTPGEHVLTYSGAGALTCTYREASL